MPYDEVEYQRLNDAFEELELAIMTPKQKMRKIIKEFKKFAR